MMLSRKWMALRNGPALVLALISLRGPDGYLPYLEASGQSKGSLAARPTWLR